ncbi:MAG: carbohydrate ABC transporter permease, partial [Microbacterium gubbeenense]
MSTTETRRVTTAGRGGTRRPPHRSAARTRTIRETLAGYTFLLPWMIGFLGLTMGPMLYSLYLSFTSYNLFSPPKWVGFDNYIRLFTDDPVFIQSAQITLFYVLVGTPIKLAAALAIAMLLNFRDRGAGFFRSAFYAPSLIGASVSVAIVWRAMFNTDGPVDRGLQIFGINLGGWIGNVSLVVPMMILLAVWQFGATMVIFLAGLKQVPKELYEAAEVDGAGAFRRFRAVTMPMLSPVVFFNLLLELVGAFQVFASAYIISNGTGGPAG